MKWNGVCIRKGCDEPAEPREAVCAGHAAARDIKDGQVPWPEFMEKQRLFPGDQITRGRAHQVLNSPWMKDEVAQLTRLVAQGYSPEGIRKIMGNQRTVSAIETKISRLGLRWKQGAGLPAWVNTRMSA